MYINGISAIMPTLVVENYLSFGKTMEPDYEGVISSNQLRRMSRMMRMGLWAGKKALADGLIETPDAIITATAYGANEDTEKFLRSLGADTNTGSPTSFIQSTHNVLGGQLALALSCTGYNMTYTQRGFSFESGLLDSQLLLAEKAGNILCGAADELTPLMVELMDELTDKGVEIPKAEAFAFFVLASVPIPNCYGVITDIVLETNDPVLFNKKWKDVFKERNAKPDNTLILTGNSTDVKTAEIPKEFKVVELMKETGQMFIFSAYALYKATEIFKDPLYADFTSIAIIRQDNQRYFRCVFLQKFQP